MWSSPIVKVAQGALRGKKNVAKTGTSYLSFSGIPYAAAPLGNLRFKPPQPPISWSGVRDAEKEGNVSCQFDPLTNSYVGDEDCLFINVHTPQLPDSSNAKEQLKKPVMVYIHGGGFTIGSGNAAMNGPDYLISEDVLLVTFNYRLGALGFMTTEDSELPGNAGLKDAVAALKWVQQNIASFGGDPENVTIFGNSAGSACAHLLVLSPMATGLFHRAIAQSGSALNAFAVTNVGRSRTLRLAKFLGCQSEDSKEVVDFLKTVPARKFVDHLLESVSPEMCTDLYFFHEINEAVKKHSIQAKNENPLYVYEFAFDGKLGLGKKMFGLESIPGVCHADELGYLFNISMMELDLAPDSSEMKVLKQMVKMWTNFAKTGNPSAGVPWLPVVPGKTCYLQIDEKSIMKHGNIAQDRMTFWDELYQSSKTD